MTSRMFRSFFRGLIGALVVLAAASGRVAAQDRQAPVAEVTAGWVGFADDGIASELLAGAAIRFSVSPRISIGPEIGYISGTNHSHLVLTGNVTGDLLPARNGRTVIPFLVVGGGLFQTREQFFNGTFTSTEGAFTVGGGVRSQASERMMIGIDARVGWEAHIRLSALIGVKLGS